MTRLYAADLVLPAAELGPENPLPPLTMPDAAKEVTNLAELPADLAGGVAYGRPATVLPYRVQDGYGRQRRETALPSLVLDNGVLRATVLPSLGGRLYSLTDLRTGRELVYRNPVFQPANLALRGAWFAGGVEWNLGSTGHTTLTCAPVHAGRVAGPDGSPVLRLWEWERTRDLPYQVDFWLPPGSAWLYVGVRVRNPHPHEVPVYWWSNIAVRQTEGTRVLAPAERAWHYGYTGRLDLVDVRDRTRPARHRDAADFFFDLPPGTHPWIAAVDESGAGLGQASTARLRGRKLFVWGTASGGQRWQEWLAPEHPGYLEIQAGLARTQLEHLPLPAHTGWDWLEAYGPVTDVHSGEWKTACAEVAAGLPDAAELAARHRQWRAVADAGVERLHTGSGWGALEVRLRGLDLPGTPFPAHTLTAEQQPWLDLLDGATPDGDPLEPPPATPVSAPWRELLETAGEGWLPWYHRGVARWHAGDRPGAERAWRTSATLAPNPWALRNLAVGERERGRQQEAADLLAEAHRLRPDSGPLAVETVTAALAAGRAREAAAVLAALPADVRASGRLRLLDARVRLALDDAEGALRIYEAGFDVPDLREGETALSGTWAELQRRLGRDEPVPRRYDFRMTGS